MNFCVMFPVLLDILMNALVEKISKQSIRNDDRRYQVTSFFIALNGGTGHIDRI